MYTYAKGKSDFFEGQSVETYMKEVALYENSLQEWSNYSLENESASPLKVYDIAVSSWYRGNMV